MKCKNCEQHYIGQTSKKIETRITEHKNAINGYDLLSLPASHTHDNGHTFNWTEKQILDQAKTKHEREFKEAWYSIDNNTINRHIDIPPAFLQVKHSSDKSKYLRQPPAINDSAPVVQDCPTMTTHPTTTIKRCNQPNNQSDAHVESGAAEEPQKGGALTERGT